MYLICFVCLYVLFVFFIKSSCIILSMSTSTIKNLFKNRALCLHIDTLHFTGGSQHLFIQVVRMRVKAARRFFLDRSFIAFIHFPSIQQWI